ncbi:unnamed protein product [Chrysoparadoxa australica]
MPDARESRPMVLALCALLHFAALLAPSVAAPPQLTSTTPGTFAAARSTCCGQRSPFARPWVQIRGGSDAEDSELTVGSEEESGEESKAEEPSGDEDVQEQKRGEGTSAELGPAPPLIPAVVQGARQLALTVIGIVVVKKLDPSQTSSHRIARVMYALYLAVSHALCMYIRVKICRQNDKTQVLVPAPKGAIKLMQSLGGKQAGAGAASPLGAAAGPQMDQLMGMAQKFMTAKRTVKEYDLAQIDAHRRRVTFISMGLGLLHFKVRKGILKPLILAAVVDLIKFLGGPLFRAYVLGMSVERPYESETALQKWMAFQQRKAELVQQAAAAEEGEGGEASGEVVEEEEDDELSEAVEVEVEVEDELSESFGDERSESDVEVEEAGGEGVLDSSELSLGEMELGPGVGA